MRFQVDTTHVGHTAAKMQELINNVANNRKTMMDAVGALNSMWAGEAHDTFQAQFQRDSTEMLSLIQDLQAVSQLFLDAKRAYEECENVAKETISALQI